MVVLKAIIGDPDLFVVTDGAADAHHAPVPGTYDAGAFGYTSTFWGSDAVNIRFDDPNLCRSCYIRIGVRSGSSGYGVRFSLMVHTSLSQVLLTENTPFEGQLPAQAAFLFK